MVETPRLEFDVRPCYRRRPLARLLRGICRGAGAVVFLAAWAPRIGAQPDTYVPRQVIVKFVPATPAADAFAVRSSVNATVKRRFESIDAELWEFTGVGVPDAVGRLKNDRRVAYVEPNYIVHAVDVFPNDPRFGDQWGLHNTGQSGGIPDADIDAPEAWTLETGDGVIVGVIDSGVDWRHVDLAANIFVNPDEIPNNHVDDDGNGYIDDVRGWDFANGDNDPDDDNGHGTHVAGTIAAAGNNGIGVTGVSWSARILPLKFLSAVGSGSTSDAILAVEYATAMGARLTNSSWGGIAFSQALRSAIEAAGEGGALFITAAGNNGLSNDVSPFYPASYDLDNIIAVASTDPDDQRSLFSNYGRTTVDLGAPGSDIVSTFPGNRYATASGTSMAAPHVSGAACVLWTAAPSLTHREVKDAILASVDAVPSLQGATVSGGRLNLDGMLSELDDVPPSSVSDLALQSTSSNTAVLTWTASGDDGDARTAFAYDLRYSSSPIDADDFDLATPVDGIPKPKPAGSPESFEVTGLDFNTTYYFGLVVEDEQGNRSLLSNVPNGTTLGVPRLEFAPDSFAADLRTGATSVQTLSVRNTAEGTLDFAFVGATTHTPSISAAFPSWIKADPSAGRVHVGQTLEVAITFDATRMSAGDYVETITFETNDPERPAVPVEVSLRVTNAPDVNAAPPRADFGVRYAGTCASLPIVLTNIGTETLVVDGIAINNPEFSAEPGGFALGVGEARTLDVTFCPRSEDVASGLPGRNPRRSRGVLAIASNDPDHPVFSVALYGDGIDPPIVSVAPGSFSEDLFTGAASARTLTISNAGASDLDFEVALEDVGGSGTRLEIFGDPSLKSNVVGVGHPLSKEQLEGLDPSFPKRFAIGTSEGIDQGQPFVKRAGGAKVLERVTAGNLEEVFGSDQNEFLGGPRTRGNLFTCTIPTTLLEHRFYMNPTTSTQVWFLVYEGEAQTGVYQLISASDVSPVGPGLGWYSSGNIVVPLRAGKFYMIATAFEDAASYYNQFDISPFPVPASFGELTAGAGWSWQPYDQFPPAPFQFVTPDAFGDAVAYYQTLVTGNAIRWVSLGEETGTVAPGLSVDVAVHFDATGVAGGDYKANLHIATNDPFAPEVVIPANLHVTGAPDIALSETRVDFGAEFIGTTAEDTLFVTNTGTELLVVSSISSSHLDYAVQGAPFGLAPGARKLIVITFAPTTAGPRTATLTLSSIDPDEGVVEVTLNGEGREAPIVAVAPTTLAADLQHGESSTPLITISNGGGSNLEFEIETGETPGGPALSTRVSIPRGATDFPRGAHAASAGRAPTGGWKSGRPTEAVPAGATAPPAAHAFATETQNRQATRLQLESPEALDFVGLAPDFIWAGDFGVGDNSFAYAVNELNQFMTIDTLTGTQTLLGMLTPFGTEAWTGMALDPTNGTMYATATNVGQSSLYVIDVDVPSATRIGPIQFPAIVALAVDDDGVMYAQDVITDELVAVDKATGLGTAIGSLGFDANFGQGMAFDPVSEQLYLSAFNNFRFQSELRIADRTTGATAVVGVIGASNPGGLVQLGWLGIPGLGGVPWLTIEPRRGVVPPGASVEVGARFDASGLNGGDYHANLRVLSNDPATPEVVVPAHLRVTGIPDAAVSESLLDYGAVFIGGVAKRTLSVSNVGTDALAVNDISAFGDYAVDVSSFVLAPGAKRDVVVTLLPTTTGPILATLTITTNDFDEGTIEVALRGEGREPPLISVTPASFEESLVTGQTVTRPMTIDNSAGAADLVWNAAARFAGDARVVVASSPVHRSVAMVDRFKDAGSPPDGRPDEDNVFAFAPGAGMGAAGTSTTGLESILASLDLNFGDVTSAIPNRFDFFDGRVSNGILDGGYDMFDGGNFLSTNFGTLIPYTDGAIVASSDFGGGGRYFTRKYPGLFVLVAELDGVDYFEINGNLGADGGGSVDGATLQARVAGSDFYGFVKRVYGAGDPSVNHLIIVQENDAASHEFATDTNSDYHRAFNLSGGRRIYYLLYAGVDGAYIDNGATLNIMGAFLNSLGISPAWVRVSPGAGVVPAGGSAAVGVTFGAVGLVGDNDAHIVVASNDPITPEVVVPVHLSVAVAPDISVSAPALVYEPTFVGAIQEDTLAVSNVGSEELWVTGVASSHADFVTDASSFALAPGANRYVVVAFRPSAIGFAIASLTIASNDPDEGELTVALIGRGIEPPVVSVFPEALVDSLAGGATSTHALTISNTGGNALDLRIVVEGAPAVGQSRTLAADAGGGGPDLFGYRWLDTNDPDGPVFDWIDAGGGTDIPMSGDDFREGIPLGFSFRYYGYTFATIGVAANGWLSFNGSSLAYPSNVPHMDFFAGAIAPYARDLFPPGASYVRYATSGSAPDRRFVVEYNHIPDFGGGNHKTFEVILFERSNAIRFQYLAAPDAPLGFGIESPDETLGLGNGGVGETFIEPARVEDLYAIEFLAPPAWLEVTPTVASVPPGGSSDFVVMVDAGDLVGGDYRARLSIYSNDPVSPVVTIPASLAVALPPSITSVDASLPRRYELHPNRPNPFNPATTISYDLPRGDHVRLVIYDVRGKEVRELVNTAKPAGRHEVTWDGRDAKGTHAASGVYFYRLLAGDFVRTKKMVLLK